MAVTGRAGDCLPQFTDRMEREQRDLNGRKEIGLLIFTGRFQTKKIQEDQTFYGSSAGDCQQKI